MLFEVRNDGGTLYGYMDVQNVRQMRDLKSVRYAYSSRPRYHGYGLQQALDYAATDITMNTVDLPVTQWVTPPSISDSGAYYPGRCDYVLLWNGPVDVLRMLKEFKPI